MRILILCLLTLCLLSCLGSAATVTIDGAHAGQTWEGWGATDLFSFDGFAVEPEAGKPGDISTEAREAILRLYYQDLGMTRIRIWPMGYEPVNDNDDPRVLDTSRFVWQGRGTRPITGIDPFCEDHLVLGREFRSSSEPFVMYPSAHQWESWFAANPDSPTWYWGKDAVFNPAVVDEYAEHALAGVLHIRDAYHYTLPYWSLFNEPSNTAKPTKETILALVLACGRRFKDAHLPTKLVICDDVTPEDEAQDIEYVLANEEARGYVGAVAYHRYRGDFVLERVKPMLARADKGHVLVGEPVSFYDTAHRYGKSVWLSEQTSYGAEGITPFDAGRARANHICDEINYGRVNAFDFMLCYFVERGRPGNEEAPIFIRFKDGRFAGAEINPFGAWISHFTRYIRPGSVQLPVSVDDPRVKGVAFRDPKSDRLTLVLVNNHAESVPVTVSLPGRRKIARIRTSSDHLRELLPGIALTAGQFTDNLPGHSITTWIADP